MRRRQVIELTVGLGLLLGPLVYALTLDGAPAPECAVAVPAPVVVEAVEAERRDPVEEVEEVEVEVVRAEPEPPTPASLAEFLFVSDAGLVLSTEAEPSWGTGRLFEPKGQVSYRVAKRADAKQVPTELWSMRGRTFDLYGADGKLCTARLGELRVVAQYDGWGLAGVLGEQWYEVDPDNASKAEIRKGLWAKVPLWLVAKIESSGDCAGALWARDAELPPPAELRRSFEPNPVSEARLAAFERSEELAELERSYEDEHARLIAAYPEDVDDYPSWDRVMTEHGARVWSWLDAQGRPQLVGLEFGEELEACGDSLVARATALELVHGDELVHVDHGHDPAAIFDADGDGQWELLYEYHGANRRLVSATLERWLEVDEDWYCPC